MKPTVFMHSVLTPDFFADALRRSIDPEHWTLFSLSGYKGDRPMLGEVHANSFRLQKRRYNRNDFAGHLYGRFEPEPGGTRIEGYFAAPRWARYFMRGWVAFAVLCGVPIFIGAIRDLLRQRQSDSGIWVGLLVPPLLIFFGTAWPRFLRRFGRGDRRFMVEFVQQVGAARVDDLETSVR